MRPTYFVIAMVIVLAMLAVLVTPGYTDGRRDCGGNDSWLFGALVLGMLLSQGNANVSVGPPCGPVYPSYGAPTYGGFAPGYGYGTPASGRIWQESGYGRNGSWTTYGETVRLPDGSSYQSEQSTTTDRFGRTTSSGSTRWNDVPTW